MKWVVYTLVSLLKVSDTMIQTLNTSSRPPQPLAARLSSSVNEIFVFSGLQVFAAEETGSGGRGNMSWTASRLYWAPLNLFYTKRLLFLWWWPQNLWIWIKMRFSRRKQECGKAFNGVWLLFMYLLLTFWQTLFFPHLWKSGWICDINWMWKEWGSSCPWGRIISTLTYCRWKMYP